MAALFLWLFLVICYNFIREYERPAVISKGQTRLIHLAKDRLGLSHE